jgi:hypothetical protein
MDAMPIFFFNATGVRQWDCRRLLSSTRRAAFDRRMHRPAGDRRFFLDPLGSWTVPCDVHREVTVMIAVFSGAAAPPTSHCVDAS